MSNLNENQTYQMNCQGVAASKSLREHFDQITKIPGKTSEDLLMKIIRDNENTEYGKKYNFCNIHSIEEYKNSVPVITYEDIDEDMERMKAGAQNVLTAYNYKHMNETSGTVGKQKAVPMTDPQADVFMKYNNQYMLALLEEGLDPSWKEGRSFSPAEGNHRLLESGVTIGCASSMMAEACKGGYEPYSSMLKAMYTSPPEAMVPGPGINTRYMHMRFAMMDAEMTGITCGFPSNLVHLLTYVHDNYEMIIEDIEKGTISTEVEMPDETRESLMKRIAPMPERAAQLREVFKNGADFQFVPAVWPKLQYVYCAGGDGLTVYDDNLRNNFFGPDIHRVYAGITASEGLWSVPSGVDVLESILVPDSAFMEFLPVEAEDDFSQCLTIDQLEVGRIYELVVTNLCGFYRYRMSDAVKVTGFYNSTPKVEFMYRVNKTINMACEKTTETALLVTAQKTAERLGLNLMDYEVYPDESAVPGKYIFMIETADEKRFDISREELEKVVLEELCEANHEFRECYEESLIQAPEVYFEQPETQLLYRDFMIFRGSSSSQLKPVHVISNEKQKKFFLALREL